MKKINLIALGIALTIFSCSKEEKKEVVVKQLTPQEKAEFRIDSMNARLDSLAKIGKIDVKATMYMVQAYEYYAHDYPNTEKAAIYTMKAGELYENILKDNKRAIRRYQTAYLSKQKFLAQPMALFRSANLYAQLGDTTRAIDMFNLFIKNHPKHDFADDAAQMIKITRMGEDEWMKSLPK